MRSLKILTFVAISCPVVMAGCAETSGFGFPVGQGDVENGRQAFIDHQCHQCHSVAGVDLPELAGKASPQLMLAAGAGSPRSYAELVTAVINPDHAISEEYREQLRLSATIPTASPMIVYSIDTMTVRQLLDIVAFLHSRYALLEDYDSGS